MVRLLQVAGWWVFILTRVALASDNASNSSNSSEPVDCALKILFLSYEAPSEAAQLYVDGFNFWVASVNDYQLKRFGAEWPPDKLEGCLTVEPHVDFLMDDPENTSSARDAIEEQVRGWRDDKMRIIIIGVAFDDCPVTRGFLKDFDMHHIVINVEDTLVFREQAANNMWGLVTGHDRTTKGFVDLTARYSQRGSCIINGDPTTLSVEELFRTTRQDFREVGVDELLYKKINGSRNMSDLAAEITSVSCDLLVVYLESSVEAATLQQELAKMRAPLVAELILPTLNESVWGELGPVGEHVFTPTEWHPSVQFSDDLLVSAEIFVELYRDWSRETLGVDRLPGVPEASAVAAGVLIQAAIFRLWDDTDTFEGFDEPPAEDDDDDDEDDEDGEDEEEDEDEDEDEEEECEEEEDEFAEGVDETIEELDLNTFYGGIHFDGKGMNVGKYQLILQYWQNAEAVVVQPRAGRSREPVLPMDSFEARDGCPPGTFRDNSSEISSSWAIPGTHCTNCSRMTYQDGFNQSVCMPCPPGQVSEEGSESCELCPAGLYRSQNQDKCNPCPFGEFSDSPGSTGCSRCPAGSFANETGQSECSVCPAGSVAPEPGGKRECNNCDPGFSTNGEPGQSHCVACSRNNYSEEEGSPICKACPATFNTENIASESSSSCLCPPGTYWHKATPDSDPICMSRYCAEGLICKGWTNDAPVAAAGYSAGAPEHEGGEPPYIVLCADTVDCPGEMPLGTCPPGHEDSRGCTQCDDGYGRRRGGCKKCDGIRWYVPILLVLGLACLLALCIYGLRYADTNVQAETVMRITALTGIVLTAVQILSVFRFIKVEWPEPINSFHIVYSELMQPMQLMRVGCLLSVQNAFQDYLLLMSVWPGAAITVFLLFKVAGCFIEQHQFKGTTTQIIQIEGTLVLLFYTSISMFSLVPWQCEENPDGTSSVVAYRQVLCWSDSEHYAMIAISCIAVLFFIVGFMSIIAWATYQYPIKITRPGGVKFLRMFRWVFNRFAPTKHYYGFIYCCRNLVVTILPVIFANDVSVQFLLVASILQFSLIFQCWNKPWRTDTANKFDAAGTVLLILILIVGSLLLSTDAAELAFLMSVFCGVVFGVFGAAVLIAMVHSIYMRLTPHKEFTFFLCHHKVAAAVLARWVKIELKLQRKGHVFLDSDELHRLDKLFNVVAYETHNFVVLLTAETLKRIWCAGEITTALRKNVNMICIACNDYEEPTDSFIQNLGTIWTDAQVTEVARQGVSMEQIQNAFVQFREIPKIRHDREASFEEQGQLIKTLMAYRGGEPLKSPQNSRAPTPVRIPTRNAGEIPEESTASAPTSRLGNNVAGLFKMRMSPRRSTHEQNLLIGDLADPEAFLVSRVLQVQLQQVLQAGIHICSKHTEEALKELPTLEPSYLIVVLTRGVLAKPGFAVVLTTALFAQSPPILVPIAADDRFMFPDAKFWADLESGAVITPQALEQYRLSLGDVLKAYKALFTVISKRFSSHGSEKIQQTEVHEVAALWPMCRIPGGTW